MKVRGFLIANVGLILSVLYTLGGVNEVQNVIDVSDEMNINDKVYYHTEFGHVAPLHLAVIEGSPDQVRQILNIQNVDVNMSLTVRLNDEFTIEGTPLHIGASLNKEENVRALLRYSYADVNVTGAMTIYDEEFGFQRTSQITPLHLAAYVDASDAIRAILEEADLVHINQYDSDNETPLHISCSLGYEEATRTLLTYGEKHNLDIHARGPMEFTPLHLAVYASQAHIVSILCNSQYHIDVNVPAYAKKTPLHVAVGSGDLYTLSTLLNEGQKRIAISAQDTFGNTALHIASQNCQNIKLLQALVHHVYTYDMGAEHLLNITNNNAHTPLESAIKARCVDIIRYLIAQPDVKIREKDMHMTKDVQLPRLEKQLLVVRELRQLWHAIFELYRSLGESMG